MLHVSQQFEKFPKKAGLEGQCTQATGTMTILGQTRLNLEPPDVVLLHFFPQQTNKNKIQTEAIGQYHYKPFQLLRDCNQSFLN